MYYRDKKWYKKWQYSLLAYLRDLIVHFLPVKKLPKGISKMLYGSEIHFVFIVHPRRSQDYFIALPFLVLLRRILSKNLFISVIRRMPPFVLDYVKTPSGINGVVVSSLLMPTFMMRNRKKTLLEARRLVRFSAKISKEGSVIGLGGWWPIVTRRGLYLDQYAKRYSSCVTNGHTVTALSVILAIEKICSMSGINISDLRVVIFGGGKMGAQIAKILLDRSIEFVSIIDSNKKRLNVLRERLQDMSRAEQVATYQANDGFSIYEVLNQHHLGICVTSSTGNIINESEIPSHFIIIDDSRPEGISRSFSGGTKIILEGGLMKMPHLVTNYNYGFGIDENIFGCLCETIILSMEKELLKPTVGSIDMTNFYRMSNFCKNNNICVGDFKSEDVVIGGTLIEEIMQNREKFVRCHELL